MTDETQVSSEGQPESVVTTVDASTVDANTDATEAPDWLQSKYMTEGRTQDDAIMEQAKAYKELHGKFGAFTGAPESYELVLGESVSEKLSSAGIDIAADDPLLIGAQEFAKASNMSQESYNGMVDMYVMQELANAEAEKEFLASEMATLGDNAQGRIDNISNWASKHMSTEDMEAIKGSITNAATAQAIESMINLTQARSSQPDEASGASGVTEQEVNDMQFAKDQYGNRRIASDPAFKAEYMKKRNELNGTGNYSRVVG